VVDDGSTDGTAMAARECGANVLSVAHRGGPAAARNLGATAARGDILLFLDSDVCVQPQTVAQISVSFQNDPDLTAIIGSYDDEPGSKDFLSQYRNLMHSFVHQQGREQASTFWSGCGAIRRNAFQEMRGFDESYERPAIEDIELGYRLTQAGRKILLDRDLKVKHLKKWTFWALVRTDIMDRGIPWTELILRDRNMPNDLNLHLSQRVSVALAFVIVGLTAMAAIYWRGYFLVPVFALVFFLLSRYWFDAGATDRSKTANACLVAATLAIAVMAYLHHMLALIPPLLLSQIILFSRHRYAESKPARRRLMRWPAGLYLLVSIAACIYYLPSHSLVFLVFGVLAAIGALNSQFYLFLAEKRGLFFAIAAIPFHLLYHFYNGVSFLVALARYGWRTFFVARSQHSSAKR
jgi:glycosyltransferase involved in cell wall biosynthesis